jgi:hypothetical protein
MIAANSPVPSDDPKDKHLLSPVLGFHIHRDRLVLRQKHLQLVKSMDVFRGLRSESARERAAHRVGKWINASAHAVKRSGTYPR